jgi:hypothetical protein
MSGKKKGARITTWMVLAGLVLFLAGTMIPTGEHDIGRYYVWLIVGSPFMAIFWFAGYTVEMKDRPLREWWMVAADLLAWGGMLLFYAITKERGTISTMNFVVFAGIPFVMGVRGTIVLLKSAL